MADAFHSLAQERLMTIDELRHRYEGDYASFVRDCLPLDLGPLEAWDGPQLWQAACAPGFTEPEDEEASDSSSFDSARTPFLTPSAPEALHTVRAKATAEFQRIFGLVKWQGAFVFQRPFAARHDNILAKEWHFDNDLEASSHARSINFFFNAANPAALKALNLPDTTFGLRIADLRHLSLPHYRGVLQRFRLNGPDIPADVPSKDVVNDRPLFQLRVNRAYAFSWTQPHIATAIEDAATLEAIRASEHNQTVASVNIAHGLR